VLSPAFHWHVSPPVPKRIQHLYRPSHPMSPSRWNDRTAVEQKTETEGEVLERVVSLCPLGYKMTVRLQGDLVHQLADQGCTGLLGPEDAVKWESYGQMMHERRQVTFSDGCGRKAKTHHSDMDSDNTMELTTPSPVMVSTDSSHAKKDIIGDVHIWRRKRSRENWMQQ
jgi:hypothetical protein